MAPTRRGDISAVAFRAFIAGEVELVSYKKSNEKRTSCLIILHLEKSNTKKTFD